MATISDMLLMSGQMSPWASLSRGLNTGIGTVSNLQRLYGQALSDRYNQQRLKQAAIATHYMPQMQEATLSKLQRNPTPSPSRYGVFQDYRTGKSYILDHAMGHLIAPGEAFVHLPTTQAPPPVPQATPPGSLMGLQPSADGASPPVSQPGAPPSLMGGLLHEASSAQQPTAGTSITLNPFTIGVRSKRGAQYSIRHPDGSVTVASSPTQASQTFAQKRNAALAEIDTLKDIIDTALAPYSGTLGLNQARLQDDLMHYNLTKDPALREQLSNYYALKKLEGPVATLYARGEGGGVPTDESIRRFTDSIFSHSAEVPFDMPQEIVVEGRKRSRKLQQQMIRAANRAYARGFPTQMPAGTQLQEGVVLPPQEEASPAVPMQAPVAAPPPGAPTYESPPMGTPHPVSPPTQTIPSFETEKGFNDWFAQLNETDRKRILNLMKKRKK